MDVHLVEMTTLQQVEALKEGRIDAGFGRVRIDDPAIRREVIQEEPVVVAMGIGDPLAGLGSVTLADVIDRTLILYPSQPRPSYADQVMTILRDHGLVPERIEEVRDVQVAIGLVASEAGIALVPESMRQVVRPDLAYVPLADEGTVSPVILSVRAADHSTEVARLERIARAAFSRSSSPVPR